MDTHMDMDRHGQGNGHAVYMCMHMCMHMCISTRMHVRVRSDAHLWHGEVASPVAHVRGRESVQRDTPLVLPPPRRRPVDRRLR